MCTLAPTPPFAEPSPQLLPPPLARLMLLLVFEYMKGSSRMRCPAAAADDLGSGVHASPCWWPTETTQWSESLRLPRRPGDSVYLGYRAMCVCLVRTAVICSTLLPSFRSCTVHARRVPPYQKAKASHNNPARSAICPGAPSQNSP